MGSLTESDKKWEAENDARALVESEVIKKDKKRMGAAKKAAKRMEKEKRIEAEAMSRIANNKYKKALKKATGKG